MKVKICGVTNIDTALEAVAFGADAIGFVFAESKRKIDPNTAGDISVQLPSHIEKVGVFVNETKERIEEIVEQAKLTIVQLHGDETPAFCHSFSVPVIKALSIGSREDLLQMEQFDCDYLLLDSPKGQYRGGNGVSFDWEILTKTNLKTKKIILAGGLHEDNVELAIKTTQPFMVDVSSGVETDGRKDHEKIRNFIAKAKSVLKNKEEVKK